MASLRSTCSVRFDAVMPLGQISPWLSPYLDEVDGRFRFFAGVLLVGRGSLRFASLRGSKAIAVAATRSNSAQCMSDGSLPEDL
jgi:hypothetical protein